MKLQWKVMNPHSGKEIEEDAKMGKQSDDNLKSLMKKFRDMEKKDPKWSEAGQECRILERTGRAFPETPAQFRIGARSYRTP